MQSQSQQQSQSQPGALRDAVPQELKEIDAQMEKLLVVAQRLGMRLAELSLQLEPVLRPRQAPEAAAGTLPKDPDAITETPLGCRICAARLELQHAEEFLSELQGRLEL